MRLVRVVALPSERKSRPAIGMSPSSGTFDWRTVSVCSTRPPRTMISPSSARTLAVISRLSRMKSGVSVPMLPEMLETSWRMSRRTVSFSPMRGVTSSWMPTSWRSTVRKGFELAWSRTWPVVIGTSWPTMRAEVALFKVMPKGVDRMRELLSFSTALRMTPKRLSPDWPPKPSVRPAVPVRELMAASRSGLAFVRSSKPSVTRAPVRASRLGAEPEKLVDANGTLLLPVPESRN